MNFWSRSPRGERRPRTQRSVSPTLEGLDPRRLLDGGGGHAGAALFGGLEGLVDHRHDAPTGIVVKAPHFYEHYVGAKLPQLNAVAAAGELLPDGNFLFAGVNQGKIDPTVAQTYVWGVDRSGKLGTGPFPDRPDIRFDALVVMRLTPGKPTTATVLDLTGKNPPVSLLAGSFFAAGRTVAVIVPGSDLPSTGLAPSQYRFNYWPEDGKPGPTHIASFAPEFTDAQVGVLRADRRDANDMDMLDVAMNDGANDNNDANDNNGANDNNDANDNNGNDLNNHDNNDRHRGRDHGRG